MESLTDTPSKKFFPDGSSDLDSLQRRNILLLATRQLVEKYVDLSLPQKKEKKPKKSAPAPTLPHDGIYEHAKETVTLGLLMMEYVDAVREGNGDRKMRVWNVLLPLFKATG